MNKINLYSEIGRLNAVLLHRPGREIEAMTPTNASEALYSDILNLDIVNEEYRHFSGALERVTKVYYVMDLLAEVLADEGVRQQLVRESCQADGCEWLAPELMGHDATTLARELIEGVEASSILTPHSSLHTQPSTLHPQERYALKPLYNLFFTRDASSCLYKKVLINSMSFEVRKRESLIYSAIFSRLCGAEVLWAQKSDAKARTEGGDVQVVRPGLLSIGMGIRTNKAGINYLVEQMRPDNDGFSISVQELPHKPDSFIHLDMVFTHLSQHHCMVFEPMLKKTGVFSGMHTYVISTAGQRTEVKEYANILEAFRSQRIDFEPIINGGADPWHQEREQWHSGSNFFAFGENHIIGYRRNRHTIEALHQAGFEVLKAEEVAAGTVDPWAYEKAVVTFAASELPRGGGGARCMTCPIDRDSVAW